MIETRSPQSISLLSINGFALHSCINERGNHEKIVWFGFGRKHSREDQTKVRGSLVGTSKKVEKQILSSSTFVSSWRKGGAASSGITRSCPSRFKPIFRSGFSIFERKEKPCLGIEMDERNLLLAWVSQPPLLVEQKKLSLAMVKDVTPESASNPVERIVRGRLLNLSLLLTPLFRCFKKLSKGELKKGVVQRKNIKGKVKSPATVRYLGFYFCTNDLHRIKSASVLLTYIRRCTILTASKSPQGFFI